MFKIENIKTAEMLEQERYDREAANVRHERDAKIASVEWRIKRHESELRLGLTPTDNISELDIYIQKLRDITKQEGFPTNIIWPEEPKL